MLSLSPGGMTATHAAKYFSQEDYYLRGAEPSQWLGKGSEALGLGGQVAEADFRNLAEGNAPDGSRLVAPKITHNKEGNDVEHHRAGNDLTFSAPKSVSVGYAAGNLELKEIWDQAVVNTMKHIEEHYSQYRSGDGVGSSGTIVAAKFDHVTSRALDPEVHSHVFLLNMTRVPGSGGKWKANEPKNIYTDKISLGMLARQEAMHLYHQAGYQTYFTYRQQLLFEIAGVSPEELETFSKRSAEIAAKVAQWKEERRFPGVSETILKGMAALDTRDPKRRVTWEDVRRAWDRGFALAGTTAKKVLERIEAARFLTPEGQCLARDAAAPDPDFRFLPPGAYPPSLAAVLRHAKVPELKEQPGYEEAKRGGDLNAARRVLDALIRREVIEEIKSRLPEGAPVCVVAVANSDGKQTNMLPAAYAEKLAGELGGKVWTGIAKVAGGRNTGATIDARLHNRQVFSGLLPPKNAAVIVVDDTFTVGGTLTALIDHLAQGGITPWCATTLATGRYGELLSPTRELVEGLLEKAGVDENQFLQEFGYSPQSLTGAEIGSYLHNGARGIEGARERFYTAEASIPGNLDGQILPLDRFGHPAEKTPDRVVRLASTYLTDREAVIDRAELLKAAAQTSGGKHSLAELNAAVDGRAGRRNGIERIGRETHGWHAGKEYYSTREMRELEARNIVALKGLGEFGSVTSPAEVEAYLAGLAGVELKSLSAGQARYQYAYQAGLASTEPRITGAAGERQNRIHLSAGQQNHVVNELAGRKGFAVTQGDPGTGKTFSAQIVESFNREVLEPTGRSHCTLNLAYTGKAALEMSKANGRPAYTVDGFLNDFHNGKIVPTGSQVVVKVDEASFVGGRQAEHLLQVLEEMKARGIEAKLVQIGDRKQLQGIQASPFFLQAADLARKGMGDYAELKEINRQQEPGLRQVAEVLNREEPGVQSGERNHRPLDPRQQLGSNAQEALAMLEAQGRVREIPDREGLVRAAVAHYLSESSKASPDPDRAAAAEKQTVLLITPLNLDRRELNDRIREARKEAGELGASLCSAVFTQVHQGVTTACFQPGMTLAFNGVRGKDGKMQPVPGTFLGQHGEIQSVDPERNTVTVRLHSAVRNITKTFDAATLSEKTTLYQRETREFSEGDRVIFRKTTRDKSVETPEGGRDKGVYNDETGAIEKLILAEGQSVALIKLDDGRRLKLHLDRFGPQHIDYGYAVTVFGGQGGTVDSVVPFHHVKPAAENDGKALESITGVELSGTEFRRWNATLSDYEKDYRAGVKIGGHSGDLGFVLVRDRKTNAVQKGVAIEFHNGRAMVADENTRILMREAGMYWTGYPDEDSGLRGGVWVTAVTNENAMGLMDRHPLGDAAYLAQLERERGAQPAPAGKGEAPATRERNFQSEIDTSAEAAQFGRASYNSFNVAVTRARHEVVVFTNSVPGLKQAVLSVDEKTSTVENSLGVKIGRLSARSVTVSDIAVRPVEVTKQLSIRPHIKKEPELELGR
jgi:conjugative relaxase-like TrwC/TraI family protein